ncbi:MAG: acetyl-CoA carboxylase carboxyltransferase subunit alpha/beta [Microlunatus sp.]|nr:acetyl-CoA carboxylase carboxyltransferase subunit alpha/beta [Microlunatus sp.]
MGQSRDVTKSAVPRAYDLIVTVLDDGSFVSWDEPIAVPADVDPGYAADLERARVRTGTDEAVRTGRGTIQGLPVAVIVSEFGFLGGSVGVACANRIETAIRRATAERLPLIAAPASGGTRMQEGTIAFLQMARITAAIGDHKKAGLVYLVYLRHPTTGGVFASWGSLGHVTVAAPGALIGFLGPRVFEAINGEPFPAGVQLAENLAQHGIIDAVVPTEALGDVAARTLRILTSTPDPVARPAEAVPTRRAAADPVWDSVLTTRDPERFGIRQLLRSGATEVIPLSGTAEGEQQRGVLTAFARIGGVSCVLAGHDRVAQREYGAIGPAALRRVRRCIRLAAELRLPLVTIIDTPGASMSREAEEGGLSSEIARCLADLMTLESPIATVLLGEGAGGGALALLPADRILAAEHAWLAPLPPEGASAILNHGDVSFAPALAEAQGIAARRLAEEGVVDVLVPENGDPHAFAATLAYEIAMALTAAAAEPAAVRLRQRSDRFRRGGSSYRT